MTSIFFPQEKEAVKEDRRTSVGGRRQETREYYNEKIAPRKIHSNRIHVKLGHPGEDRVCASAEHLHKYVKGALEVFGN